MAAAVVPTPTGDENLILTLPEYPEPDSVIVKLVMVPADDTIAVTAAPTFILPGVIKASTLSSPDLPYLVFSYKNGVASSTNIGLLKEVPDIVEKSPIIFAVG